MGAGGACFICPHPPVPIVSNYSDDIEEALYRMPVQGFVAKMEKAAGECMHVLQKGHMLPLF